MNFEFGGEKGILATLARTRAYASLVAAEVKSRRVFEHLAANSKPIATRNRNYNIDDQQFISSEVQRLLSNRRVVRISQKGGGFFGSWKQQ